MKRWLPLLLLCPLVFAQVKVAGPSKIAGPEKVVPGGGINNQIGPIDLFIDMNCSGPGTAISTTNLNCGTIGLGNSGGWALTGTGLSVATQQVACGNLGGSVQVNGVVYPVEHPSQAFAVDNAGSLRYSTIATPSIGYRFGTVAGCFIPGPPSVAQGSDVLFDSWSFTGSGKYVIMQLRNGNCGGSAQYGVTLHTNPGGVTTQTGCIVMTQGTAYWCSLHADYNGGTASMSCYNPSTGVQVGSTITASQDTGVDIDGFRQGNAEAGTAAGTTTYFQNTVVQWSGSPPSVLGPASTTQFSPIYMVSKVFNTAALSGGATTTVSPAINLPAGLTNVVWNSYENAAGTTSGCTDTAGNTYTQVTTVNLATQGHGEMWTAKNTIANPANIVTCTHTSSTFRNIMVIATAGASLTAPVDVSAVGTAAAGNANVTTGPFTPTTSTGGVVACGYITAGQVLTPGTNYYMINGNSTTSVGCELRPNAPNSSQTATLIQANTSSKWMIAVALKQ